MMTTKDAAEGRFYLEPCSQEEAAHNFHSWSISEHWNPGSDGHDIRQVFHNIDPKGFFLGRIAAESDCKGKDDKVISIISAVRFGDSKLGWIGYYLVDPAYRGHGYRILGFHRALDHLQNCTSIGLDGVMAQVENYQKSGFTTINWQNERRHGSAADVIETKEPALVQAIRENKIPGLVDISDAPVDGLAALEEQFTGLQRPDFVRNWAQFHGSGRDDPLLGRFGAAVVSIDDPNTVLGYGCVRRAETSYRVGPLYGVSGEVAKQILVKLAMAVVDADRQSPHSVPLMFDIDMPNTNLEAVNIMDGFGWKNTFPSLRMWRGPGPKVDVNGVYGICTLEIG
ncbi:hypothetical protein BGZ75_001916 [Mortierella antarctica]|nr:hypothetical protein BGZ75_001916 [Mortierella antarctica]